MDADPLGRLAELGERAAVALRERLEADRVAADDGRHHGQWYTVWAFGITAEGVDEAETLALLNIMGFDCVQGFHIAPAYPLDRARTSSLSEFHLRKSCPTKPPNCVG